MFFQSTSIIKTDKDLEVTNLSYHKIDYRQKLINKSTNKDCHRNDLIDCSGLVNTME